VHGEGEVGGFFVADVLHDHVDVDVGVGDRAENLVGDAGVVGHADHGDFGFVAVEGDAGDDGLFHGVVFLEGDERAVAFVLKAGQHAEFDFVFAGEFDRADLQHLGAEARHFEHFLEGDGLQAARLRHDARVGGVDAVDVGVNLALVRFQCGRQRHAGGVGTAAPQGGDVALFVDALEAGDHQHVAGIQIGTHLLFVDRQNARLGEGVVGEDAHLRAGVALRLQAQVFQCHRQQRNGDLLAGRHHHVQFARVGGGLNLPGQANQAVGLARHGREHHHHLMAEHFEFGHAFGHRADAFDVGDRGAAVFLYDECHVLGTRS